jgi:hypothetical protein
MITTDFECLLRGAFKELALTGVNAPHENVCYLV